MGKISLSFLAEILSWLQHTEFFFFKMALEFFSEIFEFFEPWVFLKRAKKSLP